MKEET